VRYTSHTVAESLPSGGDRNAVLTLARLARMLERACRDLTLAQYRLLALISEGEDRASQLAGQLALAKPTVSATVETLVEHGLLSRETVAGDRRAVSLTVTAAGRGALDTAEQSMRDRLDGVLARVPDLALVEEAFGQLRHALDERRTEMQRTR
ncbi:MAG: MarR family winged helix-turn-helix transcriptional regulator, partial [Acidimicrobiia bacterium]